LLYSCKEEESQTIVNDSFSGIWILVQPEIQDAHQYTIHNCNDDLITNQNTDTLINVRNSGVSKIFRRGVPTSISLMAKI